MIKGVIFDLDGTLLNTLYDIRNCANICLKQFSMPTKTYDEIRLAVGKGSAVLIKNIVPENTPSQIVEKVIDAYFKTYSQNFAIDTVAYEGISELLEKLQNDGIQMAVNSNKGDNLSKELIKKFFPNINFVEVFGRRDNVALKPNPQAANEIIELMNLQKEEVIYVGDSETDMKTANNAKLFAVGCLWGFRDRETLTESNASIIVEKPEEIYDLVIRSKE